MGLSAVWNGLSLHSPTTFKRDIVFAVAISAFGVLPAFLVGTLAIPIQSEMGITIAQIGVAAAMLFGVAGVLARPLGAVVQRIGVRVGLGSAGLLSASSLLGIALAKSFAGLMIAVAIGGVANAVAAPAANLSISVTAKDGSLGLAFGIKQAAVPIATLISGLSMPLVALTIGWRWALLGCSGIALFVAMAALVWFRPTSNAARMSLVGLDRGLPRSGLMMLTIGCGLAAAAASSLAVFLVSSAVSVGYSPGAAGGLFAVCSGLGLIGRILLGWVIDHAPSRSVYVLISNMLMLATVGYFLLATFDGTGFACGALLSYVAGWAWPGLFHYAVVKDHRLAAASATGFVQTGLSLGAALGPLTFGLLVGATSYRVAWYSIAILVFVAATMVRLGRRIVRVSRGMTVRPMFRA